MIFAQITKNFLADGLKLQISCLHLKKGQWITYTLDTMYNTGPVHSVTDTVAMAAIMTNMIKCVIINNQLFKGGNLLLIINNM